MARIEKLNCSNCGASLEIDPDMQIIYCQFCGTKLLLESENRGENDFLKKPGMIDQKHTAELNQWLEKIGIEKKIFIPEIEVVLDLQKREIEFRDLKFLKYLPNLKVLQLQDSNLNDEGTPYIKVLTELESLFISNTAVTNLDFVSDMVNMNLIYAYGTDIDDKGLEGIKNLTNLKKLDLENTRISDAGIKHMGSLKKLENLNVKGTSVTIEGVRILGNLPGLKELHYPKNIKDAEILRAGLLRLLTVNSIIDLSSQEITDDELKGLMSLKNIEMLALRSSKITDKGLEHLKVHSHLHYLDLSRNKITDAGIENLAGLTGLATLDLSGTKVTDQGVKKLKKLLAKTSIQR